ncbi:MULTISPECIES: DUF6541 family protein [unclassified Leucobacter]|uniref:DUF6541 family protein n=1 Tax=unclassified Leucobacter TaxID=2621730 RepID=UPI00301793C7
MFEWIGALPAAAVSVFVLFAPGAAVAHFSGMRGLWAWSTAPVISITLLTGVAMLLPVIGLPWYPGTALLGCAALGAAAVCLIRFALRTRFSARAAPATEDAAIRRGSARWVPISLAISGALLTVLTVVGLQSPSHISQTVDNLFHLNAVRYALDAQNASAFWISSFTTAFPQPVFYPDAWHVMVSFVVGVSGADIPTASNMFNWAVSALVWPAGALTLASQFVPRRPAVLVTAAVLTAAFPAFPLNTLSYGVLYPYFLGIAMLPLALALLLQLIGLTREARLGRWDSLALLAIFSIGGVALAHPSAFLGLLAIAMPLSLIALVAAWGHQRWPLRLVSVALTGAVLAAGVFSFTRTVTGFQWPAQTGTRAAFLQALTGAFLDAGFPVVIGLLAVGGALTSLISRSVPGIAATAIWATTSGLYVLAAGVDVPAARQILAGWYADTPRLGALAVIGIIPIAVYGCAAIVDFIERRNVLPRAALVTIGAALLGSVLVTSGYGSFLRVMQLSYDPRSSEYIDTIAPEDRALLGNLTPEGTRLALDNLISADERALLNRLDTHVAPEDLVIGSPWTGASLAYALEDRRTPMAYVTSPVSAETQLILQRFASEPDTPEMCRALDTTGVRFIIDFGQREVHGGRHEFAGIEGLDASPGVALVDREGDAKLYRITSCGLG